MTTLQERASTAAPDERRMRRHLGPVGLLFAGVGSIIGSGWLFGALNAAQIAGPSAIFSWLIAAVMIMLIGLVYAELGTMFPIAGGVVRFPHLSFGSFASYTMGWITWLAAATVAPIEVEGALQYATRYAPFTVSHAGGKVHTLTGLGYAVAVAGLAFFVVVNYFGIRWFARVNNVVVWWKLAIICLVVVAFMVTAFHGSNFTSHGFAVGGGHGIFTAIATAGITFSFLGFRQGVELAGETDNPRRNVPLAVIGSVLITAVIYVLLQIAFIAAVRPADLAHGWTNLSFTNDFGPLAAIASLIGLGWLAVMLYVDAVISPADTGLIYTTVTGRISYAMGMNGNAPRALTSTTRRGVPLVSLLVTFVVGLIVFLPFPSWQQLVGFITSATVLSFGSGSLVLAALRRDRPRQPRPFRLPGGDIVPFLALYASNLIVYWAGWDTNWKLFVAIVLGFVVLAVFHLTSKQDMPAMQWRAGAWLVPWLGGLCLLSYLGSYPDKSEHKGNLAVLGFGWGFVVMLALTALVYWLALRLRLPSNEVDANVAEVLREAEIEEHELGPAE